MTTEAMVNVTVNETSVQLEASINRSIPVDPQLPRCVAVRLLNESISVNISVNSKLNCCVQNVNHHFGPLRILYAVIYKSLDLLEG